MAQEINIAQNLADLLAAHNFEMETTDQRGQPCQTDDAKIFKFEFCGPSNHNYGTAVLLISDDSELILFYGDNLGKGIDDPKDKDAWFEFMKELKNFATRNNFYTFSPRNLNALKHTMAGMAAIKEGLFEGYYGNRKVSYSGEPTEARLMIKHNQTLGENDARYRYVESLYIETADQERFKLTFKNLAGGRAMLEHVRQGGKPYDIRGCHITEMIHEIGTLARFQRASKNRVLEGVTQELASQAQQYYKTLRESLKHLSTSRGYNKYFESWSPADIGEQEELVEDIKTLFIEQTIDSRIEAALPLLARIQQQGTAMKEAQIFENWINNLGEGTWALPDTPEAQEKLDQLMSKELIVGPDAVNATEQLYDVIGDDQLFDILGDLARRDPRANAWDDTDIQARLQELGIQLNTTPAADQQQPVAPEAGMQQPGTAPEQNVAEGDNLATFEDINSIRNLAGLPVAESRLMDSAGETLEHILGRFKHEVRNFETDGDLDDDLYHALYDYYSDNGEMPYGVAKARDGDPYNWISDRLAQELGVNENLISPMSMPVATEGAGCNMTMEGEYCPEHGLAECGGMYENMDEAMFPGSAIGDKLRDFKRGQGQSGSAKFAMGMMPAAGAGAMAGSTMATTAVGASALFAPALGAGALMGATAALGGFLTYKGLNWLAQKLFGTKEEALEFARAHLTAAGKGQPQFEFQGKTYPVKIKGPEEARDLLWKVKQLQSQIGEDVAEGDQQAFVNKHHDDPINYNGAVTGSYYESKEGDATLARIKSLALLK
jgi:hypothetical protein